MKIEKTLEDGSYDKICGMSIVLNLSPEFEAKIAERAQEQGLSKEEFAARALFEKAALSEEEREAIEDARDIAVAEYRLATTDPTQWRTLDELREAIRGPKA